MWWGPKDPTPLPPRAYGGDRYFNINEQSVIFYTGGASITLSEATCTLVGTGHGW